MEGRGNMEDVCQSVPRGHSVGMAQHFGPLMHRRPIYRGGLQQTRIQIRLEIVEHVLSLRLRKPFGPVAQVQPDLQAGMNSWEIFAAAGLPLMGVQRM